MRLGDFILSNVEVILAEWEAFARTVRAGAAMDPLALRDHAEDILRATARDMASAQTAAQQSEKAKGGGESSAHADRVDGASVEHAVGRVTSGFDIIDVVSEYRALRASVLRLWHESRPDPDQRDLADVTRFSESIDQSLTKAVAAFTRRVDESGQMFLAILGHDLRNPLFAVRIAAEEVLAQPDLGAHAREAAAQIDRSAAEMSKIILDLLDFTRTRLGRGLPVSPKAMNAEELCRELVAEFRAAHPTRPLRVASHGDMNIECDRTRLRQAIGNLIGNAIQHGRENAPVDVSLSCDRGEVLVAVRNEGDPIPPDRLPTIFDPLVRSSSPESAAERRPGSIGLGLYIASQIATAHGGDIRATSTAAAGTTFTLRLPRRCPPRA